MDGPKCYQVEVGLLKPFYGHSGRWIDEKNTLSMEAGLTKKFYRKWKGD